MRESAVGTVASLSTVFPPCRSEQPTSFLGREFGEARNLRWTPLLSVRVSRSMQLGTLSTLGAGLLFLGASGAVTAAGAQQAPGPAQPEQAINPNAPERLTRPP